MKTTKKKNAQDERKKNLSEKIPSSKIQSYFKVAPKQFVVEKKTNEDVVLDHSKAIYMQALKDKLKNLECEDVIPDQTHSIGDGEGAVGYATSGIEESPSEATIIEPDVLGATAATASTRSECIQKTAEYIDLEMKYKTLKKAYFTITSHYAEQSIKYEALLKAKSHFDQVDVGEAVASTDDFFSQNELKFLECMPLDKNKDSTFILQCLEYAYKNNSSVLCNKTLKGKAESTKIKGYGTTTEIPAKGALTPIKVIRIKELFFKRISKCEIDSASYIERVSDSNINKLIASGIKNIAKRQV